MNRVATPPVMQTCCPSALRNPPTDSLSRAPDDGAGLGARNSIQFAGAARQGTRCAGDRAGRGPRRPRSALPIPVCGGLTSAERGRQGYRDVTCRLQPSHDPVGHAAEGLPRLTLTHVTHLKFVASRIRPARPSALRLKATFVAAFLANQDGRGRIPNDGKLTA